MKGPIADSTHLVGAAIATIALIAMAEVTPAARFPSVLLGVWVAVSPWLLPGAPPVAVWIWSSTVVGVLVVVLSLPKGTVREHYEEWVRYIK